MSVSQFDEFDRRMSRISRRHTKLSRGYVTKVMDDGMMVAKPRRKTRMGTARALAILLLVMVLFKGVLHAQLGAAEYQQRIAALASGTAVEKAGAFVMTADPGTVWISGKVSSLVR
ncbi:hypothetical protein N9L47_05135 [Rhodobacteraceae bacterium]|nr:hypothetical protein [Paracoccaceae bacterium]